MFFSLVRKLLSSLSTVRLSKVNFNLKKDSSTNCVPNPNYVQTGGLTNYWTFCSDLKDIITNLTLYNRFNADFITDRNGVASSALSLSNGYVQAPSGAYFDGGDFSVMAWVYPRAFNYFSRIIDFGNGQFNENIVGSLTYQSSSQPYQSIT